MHCLADLKEGAEIPDSASSASLFQQQQKPSERSFHSDHLTAQSNHRTLFSSCNRIHKRAMEQKQQKQQPGIDYVARDGKKPSMAGWSALPPFLVSMATVPVFVGAILPGTILWSGFKAVKKAVGLGPKPSLSSNDAMVQAAAIAGVEVVPFEQRQFDLVLFGATGAWCLRVSAACRCSEISDWTPLFR